MTRIVGTLIDLWYISTRKNNSYMSGNGSGYLLRELGYAIYYTRINITLYNTILYLIVFTRSVFT